MPFPPAVAGRTAPRFSLSSCASVGSIATEVRSNRRAGAARTGVDARERCAGGRTGACPLRRGEQRRSLLPEGSFVANPRGNGRSARRGGSAIVSTSHRPSFLRRDRRTRESPNFPDRISVWKKHARAFLVTKIRSARQLCASMPIFCAPQRPRAHTERQLRLTFDGFSSRDGRGVERRG